MALAGQGDPRWVVRERTDGTNINNWHWSGERDVLPWARARLRELISPVAGEDVRVTSVADAEGDANLYNRKGQRKAVYDLKVSGTWESTGEKDDVTKGKFVVEVLVGDDDPDVMVTIDREEGKADPAYKPKFVAQCVPAIGAGVLTFAAEMAAGADVQPDDGSPAPVVEKPKSKARKEAPDVSDYKRTDGIDISSKEFRTRKAREAPLEIHDLFTCSPGDLKAAIISDRGRLEAVTRGPVECDVRVGGRWSAGGAEGVFRVVADKKVVMEKWGLKGWEESEKCQMSFNFKEADGKTALEITGEGIALEKKSAVEGYWRLQVLRPVKMLFGYGNANFL